MTNRAQWLAVIAVVAGLAALLAAGVAFTGDLDSVGVGKRAPNFTVTDLRTGETTTLSRYQGDVVLLNIWATWCLPCEQEMPSMQRLYEEFEGQGLRIVAVSIDNADGESVLDWAERRNLTFDIWHDQSGRIQRVYRTTGVPENFVIDRNGVIVKKTWATEWDHPAQKALFRRLLSREGDPAGP